MEAAAAALRKTAQWCCEAGWRRTPPKRECCWRCPVVRCGGVVQAPWRGGRLLWGRRWPCAWCVGDLVRSWVEWAGWRWRLLCPHTKARNVTIITTTTTVATKANSIACVAVCIVVIVVVVVVAAAAAVAHRFFVLVLLVLILVLFFLICIYLIFEKTNKLFSDMNKIFFQQLKITTQYTTHNKS